jgi:tetratricopeptide (TPR) repeat protein
MLFPSVYFEQFLESSLKESNVKSICRLLVALLFCSMASLCAQMVSPPQNDSLMAARAANKDKRYAEAEALMAKVTDAHPELIYHWVELGVAQKGLKKYTEAEHSFKVALGTVSPNTGAAAVAPTPVVTQFKATVTVAGTRPPEFRGLVYSNLGEIYARTGRIPEAQAAFDDAVKFFPAHASFYRHNEAILFYQAGDTDAQLDAAEKALALDPSQAVLYFIKGQALLPKAAVDPKTQKIVLPPGCAEAYARYLELEPTGEFAANARTILTDAGVPIPTPHKK